MTAEKRRWEDYVMFFTGYHRPYRNYYGSLRGTGVLCQNVGAMTMDEKFIQSDVNEPD